MSKFISGTMRTETRSGQYHDKVTRFPSQFTGVSSIEWMFFPLSISQKDINSIPERGYQNLKSLNQWRAGHTNTV